MSFLKHRRSAAGFTLIEIVVAIALLSVVLLLVLAIFSRFTVSQRQEIAEQELQEDLRLVLDQFNREVRTAYGASFATTVDGGAVHLRNQNGRCVEYRLVDEALTRTESVDSEAVVSCASVGLYPETAARVMTDGSTVVEALAFDVQPAEVLDDVLLSQGFITVRITARDRTEAIGLRLQTTTASQQTVPYTVPSGEDTSNE